MKIDIEVAFALPERQFLTRLTLETPITLREAIQLSGVKAQFPDFDFTQTSQGVFGQPRALDHQLKQGDRVEIYRELTNDPRQVRRERAQTKNQ